MKSNGLLKWLMIPMAFLVILVLVKLLPNRSSPSEPIEVQSQLTAEEIKALGLEGDTSSDTVATLVAQVRQLRADLKKAVSEREPRREEPESLHQFMDVIEQRIQLALENERQRVHEERNATGDGSETQWLLQDLQRQLDGLYQKDNAMDLPVGVGSYDGDDSDFRRDIRWIEPDDTLSQDTATPSSESGFSFPTRFGPAQNPLSNLAGTLTTSISRDVEAPTAKPTYTVPPNATLMGSVAMTALIGRVPIDGTVNDPYPFKVLIGADNLTANGIDLPEIAGAVVSGTASGDWTLSCVRGQIRAITFVFQDGTIRTLPGDGRDGSDGSQNASNSGSTQEGLGWISDQHGIPCVAGKRRSNAQQYLGSQALITAAGVGAASLIKSDNATVYAGSGGGAMSTVGISGGEAMNRLLASGVQDISQWVNKLYGQAFAAVYVEPGAQVAVHIEQPLALDYSPYGRKVDHTLGGRNDVTELD
ncbi:TIGR03752 family integrating conjugative element protein [Pseudomonas corrugata]|uniref:TIGR03752 family integrating conjugative element protein n=1 Tax=Pseudomonas corrugata TaxID=47879 RepID=UPI0006D888FF|nr:TIGR03752 family integrating conjugative element protein [Pseudomonas corrugata]